MTTKNTSPILPLRDIVIYPKMIVPLFIGRNKSMIAVDLVHNKTYKNIVFLTQKTINEDNPSAKDLYTVGTLGSILQTLKLPDGTVKILVEGKQRVHVGNITEKDGCLLGDIEPFLEETDNNDLIQKTTLTLLKNFDDYLAINKKIPLDVLETLKNLTEEPSKFIDTLTSYMPFSISEKQKILEMSSVDERAEKLLRLIEGETSVLNVEKRLRGRVKKQMEKSQREYYLNEQLKAIHKELGQSEEIVDEISELEKKIKKTSLSKEAREKASSELRKLKNMNHNSAEASVVRNYLDWILSLPWKKRTKTKDDLNEAEDILNQDHYGLDKVKERILEYLAVQKRVGKIKSQILCLVGPPGVGKTSLGQSIAKATGRKYIRMALGGVRDEAEIRGHRRTYIGAMPGKIIQGLKKINASNPLFLLDEIDKMASDFRGDPASALLEVLDPEQNSSFNDHYMEVDYDLSDVMFVTTANSLNMPQPLLDRMEIINLSGYTEDEKTEIAFKHLLPKQIENHGLKAEEFDVSRDVIVDIIRYYTREAGVRNLEREISKLCRKSVREILQSKKKKIQITQKNLEVYLGVKKYKFGMIEEAHQIGVVTGLAWTSVGGDLLSIEAIAMHGKGQIKITGKLGDVMQESAQAALSYVKSRAISLGIKPSFFEKRDIHIHVPEGAIPKDGPSAGITMTTALISTITGIPVFKDVAMTGEITLRGRVLPIGGLKEKLLAAHRGGIKTVVIPEENTKDLQDIPENIKKGLKIFPVSTMNDVLKIALTKQPLPITWDDPDEQVESKVKKKTTREESIVH